MSSEALLERLRRAAQDVVARERDLRSARQTRDELVKLAVNAGASERRAASAAGVSPSYAHRAARATLKMQRS